MILNMKDIESPYDQLSDISSAYSPHSHCSATDTDSFLGAALPPTIGTRGDEFQFPGPSMSLSSTASYLPGSHHPSDYHAGRYNGILETLRLDEPLDPYPSLKQRTNTSEPTVTQPSLFSSLIPSPPSFEPTISDLLLGAIYTSTFLYLSLSLTSPCQHPIPHAHLLFIFITLLTSLSTWLLSASPHINGGYAAWSLRMSLRFILLLFSVSSIYALYLSLNDEMYAYKSINDVGKITITIPSALRQEHILEFIEGLQLHLKERNAVVYRDIWRYIEAHPTKVVEKGVIGELQRVYEGLTAMGEMDARVLMEILGRFWSAVDGAQDGTMEK